MRNFRVIYSCWTVWLGVVLFSPAGTWAQSTSPVQLIDLQIAYTAQARLAAGGSNAIAQQIQGALMEANQVFQNSRVNARLRLVHTAEVNYTESGFVRTDLERLRTPHDGRLDQVLTWREEHQADLVCLIVERGEDYWFYGLQGPSAANAFSVIRRGYLTGSWYLPVTLSFNFGCQLDRPYADSLGAFSYAYGHSFIDGNGMPHSTVEGFGWTRLPFFSNPNLIFQGARAGIPVGESYPADNARVLNQTAPIVAAFRGGKIQTFAPDVRLIAPSNATSIYSGVPLNCDVDASDRDGSVARVDFFANGNFVGSFSNAPFRLSVSNLVAGRYSVTAVATDHLGAATVSESVNVSILPANDHFAGREVIEGRRIVLTNSNQTATREADEPNHAPWPGFGYASLWWSWTAPVSGHVTLGIQAAPITNQCNQRMLAVYTGDSLTNLTSVTNTYSDPGTPTVSFVATQDETYSIAMDSAARAPGSPVQFFCAAGPFSLRLNCSTLEMSAPKPGGQFTDPADVPLALHSFPDDGTILRASFYANGVLVGERNQAPFSMVWSNATLGMHELQVFATNSAGDALATVPIIINVSPVNDNFESRVALSGLSNAVPGINRGATLELGEEGYVGGHTVWYTWTAPSNGSLTLYTSPGEFGSGVRVFTGDALTNLAKIAEGRYANIWALQFSVFSNVTYQISVDSYHWGPDAFDLVWSFLASPANDYFADRIILTNVNTTLSGNGLGTTADPLVPADTGAIWYSWTAPARGALALSLSWSISGLGATIYSGVATNLTSLGNMNSNLGWQRAMIDVEPGIEYLIAVHATGEFQLTLDFAEQATNDDFVQRATLTGLTATAHASNTRATAEPSEPNHAGRPPIKSIWWTWAAPAKGHVTISGAGSSFGPTLAVYTGNSLTNLMLIVADWWYSKVSFDTEAGQTYQIAATGTWLWEEILSGNIHLTLTETLPPPPPGNDNFSNRLLLSAPQFTLLPNNVSATWESGEPTNSICAGHSVWWTWTPPASGRASITRAGSSYTAGLKVYTGNALGNLLPVATLQSPDQTAHFNVNAGTPYHFGFDDCAESTNATSYSVLVSTAQLVAPTNGAKFSVPGPILLQAATTPLDGITTKVDFFANGGLIGTAANSPYDLLYTNPYGGVYTIEARATDSEGLQRWTPSVSIRLAPANDDFANRISISGERFSANVPTHGATVEAGEPLSHTNGGRATVWWTWTPAKSGPVCLTELWSSYLAFAKIYTGDSVSNLTPVPYQPTTDLAPRTLTANVTAGVPYHIAVDGLMVSGYPGDGYLSFNLFTQPTNDLFAARASLVGPQAIWHSWTYLATMEAGEPNPPGWTQTGRTVWSSWTAPTSGNVSLTLTNGFTIRGNTLAVYTGSSLTNLVRLADNRLANGTYGTQLSFRAQPGVPYQICVGNDELTEIHAGVEFDLGLAFSAAPPNDNFADRTELSGPHATGTANFATASSEAGEPAKAGVSAQRSVWWSWMAPANGRVGLTLRDGLNAISRRVSVFTGESLGSLTPVATNNPAALPATVRDFYAAEALSFNADAGTRYQIVVDTSVATDETLSLDLSLARAEVIDPPDGAIVFAPTNLLFELSVTDVLPVVTQVVWRAASDSWEPWVKVATNLGFSQVWSNAIPGDHSVVVFTTDAEGHTSISAPTRLLVQLRNDHLESATVRSGVSDEWTAINVGATQQPGEPLLIDGFGATVWWSWTAPAEGLVTISDAAWTYDPNRGQVMGVFTGASVTNLSLQASNLYWDDATIWWQTTPAMSFHAVTGTTYHIAVDGRNGWQGGFNLRLQMSKARLTAPAPGTVFVDPVAVLLRAEPIDLEGEVRQMDFYAGPNLLGSVTNRPFEFSWSSVPVGDHILSVRAIDEFGHSTTSESANIRVTRGNDDFANRIALVGSNLTVHFDNGPATHEVGEVGIGGWPSPIFSQCGDCPPEEFGAGKTLWWTWTAPADGLLILDVSQDANGLALASILSGNSITNLQRLAHNGFLECSMCFGCAKKTGERAFLAVTNGQVCQLALDVVDPATAGAHQFQLRFQALPDNDDFAQRRIINGAAATVAVANWAAGSEPGEPNPTGSPTVRSVWYSWTAPEMGRAMLSKPPAPTQGEMTAQSVIIIVFPPLPCDPLYEPPQAGPYHPVFSVFTGDAISNLTHVASGAAVSFGAVAGNTYAIAVDGQYGSMGEDTMILSMVPRPSNDRFADRIVLSGVAPTLSGHNTNASPEVGEPPLLNVTSQGRSVWWSWTAPVSGTVRIGENQAFDIGVFVGSAVADLLPVARGYGAVDFFAHAGTTYQIAVTDSAGFEGAFNLTLSGLPTPPQFTTPSALPLPDGRFQLSIAGTLGQSFAIQASTNLVNWEVLTIDTIQSSPSGFIDHDAASHPQRFYRMLPLETFQSLAPTVDPRVALPPRQVSTGFTIRIQGAPGQLFSLHASTNLVDWEEIKRGLISGAGVDIQDLNATNHPSRFYKILPLP